MTPKQISRLIAKRDARHTYAYDAASNRYIVNCPAILGASKVCMLAGAVEDSDTHAQADAICTALDKLLKVMK